MKCLISTDFSEDNYKPLSSIKENQIDFINQLEEAFIKHRHLDNKISHQLADSISYRKLQIHLSILLADIKNSLNGIDYFDERFQKLQAHFEKLKNSHSMDLRFSLVLTKKTQ